MVETFKITWNSFITEKLGNIKDHYKITSCIGRGTTIYILTVSGAYGEVRKCQHKTMKSLRAVKIINKKCLEDDEREKLLNEIQILKQMV